MSRLMKVVAIPVLAVALMAVAGASKAEAGGFGISIGGHGVHVGHHHPGFRPGFRPPYRPGFGYRPYFHDTSHLHYHGPRVVPHNGHFHVLPGHYDVHRTGHWHR